MKTEKQVIRIRLDYLQGPIWMSDIDTGEPLTGIEVIDNDLEIREPNRRAGQMFSSYYEFDTHDVPCWFNHEKEKAEKEIMIDLITQIVARLNEINDGSFVIEDYETERLKSL